MKIFISWSKSSSHAVALALKEWLEIVIQEVVPFVSSEDIAKGSRGRNTITKELEGTGEGIVCITRANLREPWLNFEAGALSKQAGEASVRTILLDLPPQDIEGPLADFQHTEIHDKQDVLKFLSSINDHCTRPLQQSVLEKVFENNWADLEAKITIIKNEIEIDKDAHPDELDSEQSRTVPDLVGEILERVRGIERSIRLTSPEPNPSSQMTNLHAMKRESEELRNNAIRHGLLPTEGVVSEASVGSESGDVDPEVAAKLQARVRMLLEQAGGRVRHQALGIGTVVGQRPNDARRVVVKFDKDPEKNVAVDVVQLRPFRGTTETQRE